MLVIPSTVGTVACTDGGLMELRDSLINLPGTVGGSLSRNIERLPATTFTSSTGIAVPDEGILLSLRVMKNESGGSAVADTQSLGTLRSGSAIADQTATFSNLKKSTRYVIELIAGDQAVSRRCFKTRGEFTNAEQNLQPDGSAILGGELGGEGEYINRTGCFAVASTRQDIADCMCNGTRGGTRILAGVSAWSQTARQHWMCPDLDS